MEDDPVEPEFPEDDPVDDTITIEGKEADKIEPKFIKATSTLTSYALAHSDPITGDLGNGIFVEKIDADKVPAATREKLLS